MCASCCSHCLQTSGARGTLGAAQGRSPSCSGGLAGCVAGREGGGRASLCTGLCLAPDNCSFCIYVSIFCCICCCCSCCYICCCCICCCICCCCCCWCICCCCICCNTLSMSTGGVGPVALPRAGAEPCAAPKVCAGCYWQRTAVWRAAAGLLAAVPALCSAGLPLDAGAKRTPLGSPSWSRSLPSWQRIAGRLESLEASVGTFNVWVPEEEEGVTAVSLPVSVESLSEDSGSSTSDRLLESDIVVVSLSKDFSH